MDWILVNPLIFQVCCSSDGSRLVNKDALKGMCCSWQQSYIWTFHHRNQWTNGCVWGTTGCWQGRLFSQVFLFLEEITFRCSAALFLYSLLFPAVYMSVSSKILHLPYGAVSFSPHIYICMFIFWAEQVFCIFACLPSQTLFCYRFLETPWSAELKCYCCQTLFGCSAQSEMFYIRKM